MATARRGGVAAGSASCPEPAPGWIATRPLSDETWAGGGARSPSRPATSLATQTTEPVLTQIGAVQAAMDKVALNLVADHVHHCMANADGDERAAKADELMGAVARLLKTG